VTAMVAERQGDSIRWHAEAFVDKYSQDQVDWVLKNHPIKGVPLQGRHFEQFKLKPEDGQAYSDGNLVTTQGLTVIWRLATGGGGTTLINTTTRLGTGNGSGTAAAGDTDLSAAAGSANRWFQIMDSTFPSFATNVLTAKATWATGDGNYAWNEWGLDVGTATVASSNAVQAVSGNNGLFSHKTSAALGTKTTGSWVLTVTVTIT
jgi:hypothetical protein